MAARFLPKCRPAALAGLLLASLCAPPGAVDANTASDYLAFVNGQDDVCGPAVDADGAQSFGDAHAVGFPVVSDDYCDGDSTVVVQRVVAPGEAVDCQDDPTGPGTTTACTGGSSAYADTTWGLGLFGGDYPLATSATVEIASDSGGWPDPAYVEARVCYVYAMDGGGFQAGDRDCTPTGPALCLSSFTTSAGGGGTFFITDPPAGTTIDQVILFWVPDVPPTPCGTLDPVRRFTTAFTYQAESFGNAASATLSPPGWDAYASVGAATLGEAGCFLFVNGVSYIESLIGPAEGPLCTLNEASTGVVLGGPGLDYCQVVAVAWGVGNEYVHAESGPAFQPGVTLPNCSAPLPLPPPPPPPSTCGPSDFRVDGVASTHGADYDGATQVTLFLGDGRILDHAYVEAPTATVSHDDGEAVHQWTVASLEPGYHQVTIDIETACPSPSSGANEWFGPGHDQWMGHKCADLPLPGDALRFNVGFHAMPSLTVGQPLYGGTVALPVPELGFAALTTEPTALQGFLEQTDADANVEACEVDGLFLPRFSPNDPLYPSQQNAMGEIRAPAAWELTPGSPVKTICIVDSGVDFNHPDLASPRWLGALGQNDGMDNYGHGTAVAGIAAATTDNMLGIAGVSQAAIKAIRVTDTNGKAYASTISWGIDWCSWDGVGSGGYVINLSMASPSKKRSFAAGRAIEQAWNRGSLVVVPAPASDPLALAVACDQSHASCDERGPGTDLAAPGVGLLTTCSTALAACKALCSPATPGYSACTGSSMAAAVVSGVAALVWSSRPTLSNAWLRALLQCSASDLGTPGTDSVYGYGRVDVRAALDLAAFTGTPTCRPPDAPIITDAEAGDAGASIEWALASDGGSPVTKFRVYRSSDPDGGEVLAGEVNADKRSFRDVWLWVGEAYQYSLSAVTMFGGEGPRSAPVWVVTQPQPTSTRAGHASCYPETVERDTGATGGTYHVDGGSGTFALIINGEYKNGPPNTPCTFTVSIDAAGVTVTGGQARVTAVASNWCTAGPGDPHCGSPTYFTWERSSATVCFSVPFKLWVNSSMVDRGTVRICG